MNALLPRLRRAKALAGNRTILSHPLRWHLSGALMLLAALAVPASAATLNVPSQYATIGAAISAASGGDTILVADGTYSAAGDLNLNIGKSLTIQSVNGAGSTFINCGDNAFVGQATANVTIQGFTVENCTYSFSVIEAYAPLTIDQCVFKNNSLATFGSGSLVFANIFTGTLVVSNCTFDHNTSHAAIEPGGEGSNASISNCTFTNNTGQSGGSGAINSNSASGTISNCTFTGNTSATNAYGGAVYWINGGLTITDSSFTNNSSPNSGGGALFVGASGLNTPVTLTRCVFSGNSGANGGAVILSESDRAVSVTATNCLFTGNSASSDGAAFAAVSGSGGNSIELINSSFYGNAYTGGATGAGTIAGTSSTTLTITNSILYGDTTTKEISTANPPNTITVSHSDIHGSGFLGTNGNIDADPLYVSPAAGDLRLSYNSPAINAGTTGASVPTTDYLGDTRDVNPDMGAYEYLILATPGGTVVTTQDQAFTGSVATFADMSDSVAPVSGFSATINWGDGTPPSAGTVTQPGGAGTSYTVSGSHTYAASGSYTVTVSISTPAGVTATATSSADIGAAVATHFTVSAPSTATAGTPISFTVTAEDASNVTVTGYAGTVHFTTSDRYGIVPANTTLAGGIGTFTATLGTVGTQTITATDTVTSSITGTSNNIVVTHGPAALLGIRVRSTTIVDGTPTVLNVYAFDIYGNQVTDYTGTVHFSSSDPSAVLPADATLTNGQGSFGATLYALGSQSITATDTVTSSINGTQTFTVIDRSAARFRIGASPGSVTAGTPVTVSITAIDTNGNIARGYTGTIHFTTADPQATLPADATLTNGQGTFSATFKTVGRYTVTITDTTTSSLTGTSGSVTVSPGAATHLKATAQASAAANRPFGVVVQALDAYGNIATGYTGTVHLSSTDANATLPADGVLYSGQRIFLATLKTLGSQTVTATDTVTSSLTATTGTVTITAH